MNYYEHHIGDYAEATQHLSILEDGVYTRLLRKYYASEKPLPADLAMVQRLIVARSKDEREAVEAVLREFFELRDDGWHQDRCDTEIARYRAGEPEREAKKANEDARTRRHREERATLFKELNNAGQHAQWNIGIKDLRALVAALQQPEPATPETQPATPVTPPETLQAAEPVTAPATPVTATHTHTQTPDTTTHTQTPTKERNTSLGGKPPEPPGFARFWAAWPKHFRKESRGKCLEAWDRAGCEAIAASVVAHVERKKASTEWLKDGGEYIPAPLVYLNKRRWEGAEDTSDTTPKWFDQAGFPTKDDALNAGCHGGNFREFRNGLRVQQEVVA
jgi:uncharacterized protein YdaU (DUF1376 family)